MGSILKRRSVDPTRARRVRVATRTVARRRVRKVLVPTHFSDSAAPDSSARTFPRAGEVFSDLRHSSRLEGGGTRGGS